jgi:hypothetical protein
MTVAQLETLIAGRSDGGDNQASTERALWRAIRNEICKLYEVKEIDVNVTAHPTYIADNFDSTGLGINGMAGFAICNGDNGTRNRIGLVAVGVGTDFTKLGLEGGNANASVAEVSTGFGIGGRPGVGDGGKLLVASGVSESSEYLESISVASTLPAAQSVSIMQPNIMTLMIQRVA